MATIKSYTDLEQSKKLAKILPLQSADMQWIKMSEDGDPDAYRVGILVNPELIDEDDIPCWSLAALLGVLPEASLNTFKDKKWNAMVKHNDKMIYGDKDNPIDACYELILKLHELKNK